jgi:hypothetical protein
MAAAAVVPRGILSFLPLYVVVLCTNKRSCPYAYSKRLGEHYCLGANAMQGPGAKQGWMPHHLTTSTRCPEREKGEEWNSKTVSETFIQAGMTQHEAVGFAVSH